MTLSPDPLAQAAGTTLALPAVLDTSAAAALRDNLLSAIAAAHPIVLDASEVTRLGQACLQVLEAARRLAAKRGIAFRIAGSGAPVTYMVTLAGLTELLSA